METSTVASVLNFFHVLFGALWIGGAVFAGAVAGPVLGMIDGPAAAAAAPAFALRTSMFFRVTGTLAILFGLALAWAEGAFGPLAWAALVLTIVIFGWAEAVVGKRGRAIMTLPLAERPIAVKAVVQASIVQNVLFLVLIGIMVALRYGR